MRLTDKGLCSAETWTEKKYDLFSFDREQMRKQTKLTPQWVHFGAGNIFRAYQTMLMQKLLNEGKCNTGLIAVEGYDYEIVKGTLHPHDDLNILVTLKACGEVEKTVIGCVARSLVLDRKDEDWAELEAIFANPSLQMASFTITEKGYQISDTRGELLPVIQADITAGPDHSESYLGRVTSLIAHRYHNGAASLALVSMDNCTHNGEKLQNAVLTIARGWVAEGKIESGFEDYLTCSDKIAFPWTMIDKITPRPDTSIMEILKEDGVEEIEPVITEKKTYIAPFVNAEECEYLVIEDAFPNGRLPLEETGVLFCDRETVKKVEKMKVSTCLNPVHTGLAVFGCLLGFDKISEEMKDPDLSVMAEKIGRVEGLPVVTDPGILEPEKFLNEVLTLRIPNPFMPDTPQRIATDTSQKLSVRYGETVKSYLAEGKDIHDLKVIPLVYAGWLRYLLGIDDRGQKMELSPDPMLNQLCPLLAEITVSTEPQDLSNVRDILKNKIIFGFDMEEAGLMPVVLDLFSAMLQGPGAVRKTVHSQCNCK